MNPTIHCILKSHSKYVDSNPEISVQEAGINEKTYTFDISRKFTVGNSTSSRRYYYPDDFVIWRQIIERIIATSKYPPINCESCIHQHTHEVSGICENNYERKNIPISINFDTIKNESTMQRKNC